MPDELQQAVVEGQHARTLLQDEMLARAFLSAEERATDEWKNAQDTEQRERAWYKVQALAAVLEELHGIIAEGQSAEAQIKNREERLKREATTRGGLR